ncbi:MAG: response regulator [Planctomycetota bacterium]
MPQPTSPTNLTTGQIAKHCRVNYRTVLRWIKAGRLTAHQLPGSRGDHRVEVDDFVSFLQENDLPIPLEFVRNTKRVLIVDDEPAMANSIGRVLRRAGYETQYAPNGFQAGAMLNTFAPQVVTLDLQMPGVNGRDVLRFIRDHADYTNLKVLVVSGQSLREIQDAINAGADRGIQKPFDNQTLLTHIHQLTGQIPA